MPVQPQDLTAKARIREAALELFAGDGVAGTSMRSIAAKAGVSSSLVVHHFGSKAALRTAVDDAVLHAFDDALSGVDLSGSPLEVSEQLNTAISGIIGGDRAVRDYLARSLLEASPASFRLFDALVELVGQGLDTLEAGGHVRRGSDKTWRSYTVLFIILGPMVMSRQIEARMGVDAFDPAVVRARSACNIEILQHGLFETR